MYVQNKELQRHFMKLYARTGKLKIYTSSYIPNLSLIF